MGIGRLVERLLAQFVEELNRSLGAGDSIDARARLNQIRRLSLPMPRYASVT